MPSIQASTSELIIHTALLLLERCKSFNTWYSSPEYDCCSSSAVSGARGSESEGELYPAHPAAKKEPPWTTPENETVWAGKVDGLIPPPTGVVTYLGQWLPFPGASCCHAPTSSALLCCVQITCTTHCVFCGQCHVLVCSSALLLLL